MAVKEKVIGGILAFTPHSLARAEVHLQPRTTAQVAGMEYCIS